MNGTPALHLCVGQCGIQLGTQYLEIERAANTKRKGHPAAPVILVDSESKVVRRACGSATPGSLDDRSIIIRKGGCGNNWARGWLLGREPFVVEGSFSSYCSIGERVLECARRAIEKLDSLSATILFHSLGGGTGSGLGAHLLELYRDEIPKTYLYSVAVTPHPSGDSPLQNYNCLLSLPAIHEFTDACVLLANEDFIGNDMSSTIHNRGPSYSMQDINAKFSRNLLGLSYPALPLFDKAQQSTQFQNLLTFLSWDTFHKFISLRQVSSRTASLPYLVKQVLTQKLKLGSSHAREHIRTYSSVLVTRGFKKGETTQIHPDVKVQVKRLLYPSQDNVNKLEILHNEDTFPYGEGSSVTLGLNSSLETDFFQRVLTKSQCLLSHGAYLHWYERFGVTKESFQRSLEILEKINLDYVGSH